jgi:hypothetical protein
MVRDYNLIAGYLKGQNISFSSGLPGCYENPSKIAYEAVVRFFFQLVVRSVNGIMMSLRRIGLMGILAGQHDQQSLPTIQEI